jgi:hypothetical protein
MLRRGLDQGHPLRAHARARANIIPNHWQSHLQHDKFDIHQCSVKDFFDMMECYQVADNLDPLLELQNHQKLIKTNLKNQWKSQIRVVH